MQGMGAKANDITSLVCLLTRNAEVEKVNMGNKSSSFCLQANTEEPANAYSIYCREKETKQFVTTSSLGFKVKLMVGKLTIQELSAIKKQNN